MAGYAGDEYWARFAAQYVEASRITADTPAIELATRLGMERKHIAMNAYRARQRGMMVGGLYGKLPYLTEKALQILAESGHREIPLVDFQPVISANSKAEALALVWDVTIQLESWDPRTGPFKYQPERLKRIGEKDSNAQDD